MALLLALSATGGDVLSAVNGTELPGKYHQYTRGDRIQIASN
jgi:hypothetical protein